MNNHPHHNDGPALAALLSAGIGAATLGLATVLSEASTSFKDLMNWWEPAGPLTGKTGTAVILWLTSWLFLHLCWRRWETPFHNKVWQWSLALIALGWIGTFPPIFKTFAGH